MYSINRDFDLNSTVDVVDLTGEAPVIGRRKNTLAMKTQTRNQLIADLRSIAEKNTFTDKEKKIAYGIVKGKVFRHLAFSSESRPSAQAIALKDALVLKMNGDEKAGSSAALVESQLNTKTNKKPNSIVYHKMIVPVKFGTDLYAATLDVELRKVNQNNGDAFHQMGLYDVHMTKIATRNPAAKGNNGRSNMGSTTGKIGIQQLLQSVNGVGNNNYFDANGNSIWQTEAEEKNIEQAVNGFTVSKPTTKYSITAADSAEFSQGYADTASIDAAHSAAKAHALRRSSQSQKEGCDAEGAWKILPRAKRGSRNQLF